jgi:MFS family permease
MKIHDEEGLKQALSDFRRPGVVQPSQRERDRVRRRKIGLCLSVTGALWSASVFIATWFFESPLPRLYVVLMALLALGVIWYLFAAHADRYGSRTYGDQILSDVEFYKEIGATLGRLPVLAIAIIVACVLGVVASFASMPSKSESCAVQDSQGYWLEDGKGTKLRPMTEDEFRKFGEEKKDRPAAGILFAFSVLAAIGFFYGPGSRSRSSEDDSRTQR